MFYAYDYYYLILVVPALIFSLYAQFKITRTFEKYNVPSGRGRTAAEVAREILDYNGAGNVEVSRVSGNLTDHYDPGKETVFLSDRVYDKQTVAAIGVAAHETGHAIQHRERYGFLKMRSRILPVARIGSNLSFPVILIGLFFSSRPVVLLGIFLFGLLALFQLITLPVEFNASGRALQILDSAGMLSEQELSGAKKVLSAAALTYVAALSTTIMQMLRLLLRYGSTGSKRRSR